MLVLSSQARLLGSNPVVWLCDQEPVRTFQKGPPPEKAKLRRWWTYLSQLRLTVHHIQGVMKPVRTPVAIFGSLGVCIYVPASRHWLISYSPIHLTETAVIV